MDYTKKKISCIDCGSLFTLKVHQDRHLCWGFRADTDFLRGVAGYWKRKKQSIDRGRRTDRTGHIIRFDLTGRQMVKLFEQAGITDKDIGLRRGNFVLARHDDLGDYAWGNAEFITVTENHQEKRGRYGKQLMAEGVVYESMGEVSRKFDLPYASIRLRLYNEKYPDWKFL